MMGHSSCSLFNFLAVIQRLLILSKLKDISIEFKPFKNFAIDQKIRATYSLLKLWHNFGYSGFRPIRQEFWLPGFWQGLLLLSLFTFQLSFTHRKPCSVIGLVNTYNFILGFRYDIEILLMNVSRVNAIAAVLFFP